MKQRRKPKQIRKKVMSPNKTLTYQRHYHGVWGRHW